MRKSILVVSLFACFGLVRCNCGPGPEESADTGSSAAKDGGGGGQDAGTASGADAAAAAPDAAAQTPDTGPKLQNEMHLTFDTTTGGSNLAVAAYDCTDPNVTVSHSGAQGGRHQIIGYTTYQMAVQIHGALTVGTTFTCTTAEIGTLGAGQCRIWFTEEGTYRSWVSTGGTLTIDSLDRTYFNLTGTIPMGAEPGGTGNQATGTFDAVVNVKASST